MAVLPTREFSIEFDTGVWTDVTADMVNVATRRGRNRELGAYETGGGTVVLRNETRKYDPEYAAGPYYGKLRPNRRVRFRAVISGFTYPIFQGYIDRITQNYDGPNGAYTTIDFSDLFKILNKVELPSSVYAAEVRTDTPALWWRFGATAGSTVAVDSSGNNRPGVTTGAPSFGASSLAVRETDTAVLFPTSLDGIQGVYPAGTFPLTTTATWEWLVSGSSSGFSGNLATVATLGGTPSGIEVDKRGDDLLNVTVVNNAGTPIVLQTTIPVFDGTVHHIAVVVTAGSPILIYVDGINRASAVTNFIGSMANTVDPWIAVANNVAYPPFFNFGVVMTLDELALYSTAITPTRVAVHNAAARTPWNGDTVATRAGRVLDLAGVAAADRTIGTGSTSLQSTSLGGSALAYLQKIEETELGHVFVTKDGKIRLIGRQEAEVGAYLSSNATLTDAPVALLEVGYLEGSPKYDVDEDDIIDRATVSRDGSIAITYADAAAIAEFQIVDATFDGLLHDTDTYSADYAAWIVNTHRTPITRVDAVTIALHADSTLVTAQKMLILELVDRVTLRRRPKVGAAISYDYRVEQIGHSTGGGYWNATLQLTPYNLGAGGYPVFVWDTTKWDQQVWGI